VLENIDFVKADHDFAGWNTEDDGSGDPWLAGEHFDISENTILYAQWTARFGIMLLDTTHTFEEVSYGYEPQEEFEVTIRNTNEQSDTGELTLTLDNTNDFTIEPASIANIPVGEEDTFTIVPNDNLAAGHYTAKVTVTGDGGITASITVGFTVGRKNISIYSVEPLTKTYDGNATATAGGVVFSGLLDGEELAVGIDYEVSAEFTDFNFGIGNRSYVYTVTLKDTELAGNYSLSVNTKGGTDGTVNCEHDSEWDTTLEPTCAAAGAKELQCTICNFVLDTDSIPVLAHTFPATTPATCIANSIPGNCTKCDAVNPEVVVLAFGHDIKWIITTAPIFPSTSGEETKKCTQCEYSESETREYPIRAIGQTGPGGGIIFYVADGLSGRPTGFTVHGYGTAGDEGYFASYTAYYLEAAPENITGNQQWASISDLIPGLSQNSSDQTDWVIGRGRMNTAIIIARGKNHSTPYTTPAASACAVLRTGDKDDWFLPSRNELNVLAQIRGQHGIPNTGLFWSSSQTNSSYAWSQDFSTGYQGNYYGKNRNYSVRAVRAF